MDAVQLLKAKRKVDGRIVTEAEMEVAAVGLAEFNRQAEADFGLGANLRSMVMRIRERPSWDGAKHVRLVQSAWRLRWWERNGKQRRATPAVVWGGAFENVVQDAADEAAGKRIEIPPDSPLKSARYSGGRSWDELTPREQMMARQNLSMGVRPGDVREACPVQPSGNGYTAENFLEDE